MFSIVIPTMQKDNEILNLLLNELIECEQVGEIILIDNSCKGFSASSEKVRVIVPDKNLYVNPAWNLGVEKSRYKYIGILNDDIIFPKNAFQQIYDFLYKNEIGLLGLDSIKCSDKSCFTGYPKDSEIKFCPIDIRGNCWGSAIFGEKDNFCHIPDDIKIWYGDDYLFEKNMDKNNYKIYNADIKHLHSNTSALKEFEKIKNDDLLEYQKLNIDSSNQKTKWKRKFDLFVSIGAGCSCASALKDAALRYYSYPFDWLFGADFLDRIKILTDNFENWLEKDYLTKIGSRTSPEPCDIYKNIKTGIVFNHDFPIDTPLEDSFSNVKAKYDRRIERLIKQIESSKSVLFVYIEIPNQRKEISQKDLVKGYELLKSRFPDTDVNILYIFNEGEVGINDKKICHVTDNITRISFDYNAYDEEFPYAVIPALLNNLMENYSITNKHLSLKNRIQKYIFQKRQYIFSIRRISRQRKVMYILGLKITFKREKKK